MSNPQTTLQVAKKIIDEVLKTRPDLQRAKKLLDEERGDEPSFAEEFLNEFRASLQNAPAPIEGGWVVEGAWSPASAPEYWRFSGLFSTDNLQATRFARKVDAECMAANMLNGINVRVCFHEWG